MNKELLNQIVETFNSGTTNKVEEIFSKDYVDHQRPEWMSEEGPEEFKAIVKLARDSLPNLKVSILGEVVADNNYVVARLKWVSDNAIRETIDMLRIENGKFVEHWGAKVYSKKLS